MQARQEQETGEGSSQIVTDGISYIIYKEAGGEKSQEAGGEESQEPE